MRIALALLLVLNGAYVFAQPQKGADYSGILRRGGPYNLTENNADIQFSYENSNAPALVSLRAKYKLDSIAGFGNEASRLINLLHWVHNTVRHDGTQESGILNVNATEILDAAISRKVGVSCGELATTLNDCFLAMGWPSRKIYCFPKDSLHTDFDSHVINAVFLSSQNKWIWLDPTNDAYVMDERGNLLGIDEVRQRLIDNKPLIVNPDANWNHHQSMTKEYYLDIYMAKNLYRIYTPMSSSFNYESPGNEKPLQYVSLVPVNTDPPVMNAGLKKGNKIYTTHNPTLFWAPPVD